MYVLALLLFLALQPAQQVVKNGKSTPGTNTASQQPTRGPSDADVQGISTLGAPQSEPKESGHHDKLDESRYAVEIKKQPPPEDTPLFKWYLLATAFGVIVNAFIWFAILQQTRLNYTQVRINLLTAKAAMRSARAAKRSADAALMNAQSVINAERAWIVFELIDDGGGVFRAVMTNYGRTPAQVIGYNIQRSATMTLDDIQNHPSPYEDDPTRPGQPFLVQDEAWDIERIKLNDPGWTLPGTVKKTFLYWGVIHYRDTIRNSEHDTWFMRRYAASTNEFWIIGPPSYNSYT